MGAENNILEYLVKNPEGASTSEIAEATGHTRATASKYLEMLKLQNKANFRAVGKAKLWVAAGKRKLILIAEDEEHIRRLIRAILSQEGYDFIEARDGKEALEKVSEQMPDLVILDLMMPKIDGVEVCKQLKKNALTRKIPIIMLTAKREMTDRVVGVKVGADDYLTKPFESRELRARVKTFLDREKRERNPITNLPAFDYVLSKLKALDKTLTAYFLFFKNLDLYKKHYGFSKTSELIRLTSQIIVHNLDRFGAKNFAGHDEQNNFIIISESHNAKQMLKEIQNEFESTIPFFYDIDYENVDLKGIPLIQLETAQLSKDDLGKLDRLNERLKQLRGG